MPTRGPDPDSPKTPPTPSEVQPTHERLASPRTLVKALFLTAVAEAMGLKHPAPTPPPK